MNVSAWYAADHAWWLDREATAYGYQTEMVEYAEANPRPTLRGFLETNKGMTGGDVR